MTEQHDRLIQNKPRKNKNAKNRNSKRKFQQLVKDYKSAQQHMFFHNRADIHLRPKRENKKLLLNEQDLIQQLFATKLLKLQLISLYRSRYYEIIFNNQQSRIKKGFTVILKQSIYNFNQQQELSGISNSLSLNSPVTPIQLTFVRNLNKSDASRPLSQSPDTSSYKQDKKTQKLYTIQNENSKSIDINAKRFYRNQRKKKKSVSIGDFQQINIFQGNFQQINICKREKTHTNSKSHDIFQKIRSYSQFSKAKNNTNMSVFSRIIKKQKTETLFRIKNFPRDRQKLRKEKKKLKKKIHSNLFHDRFGKLLLEIVLSIVKDRMYNAWIKLKKFRRKQSYSIYNSARIKNFINKLEVIEYKFKFEKLKSAFIKLQKQPPKYTFKSKLFLRKQKVRSQTPKKTNYLLNPNFVSSKNKQKKKTTLHISKSPTQSKFTINKKSKTNEKSKGKVKKRKVKSKPKSIHISKQKALKKFINQKPQQNELVKKYLTNMTSQPSQLTNYLQDSSFEDMQFQTESKMTSNINQQIDSEY